MDVAELANKITWWLDRDALRRHETSREKNTCQMMSGDTTGSHTMLQDVK